MTQESAQEVPQVDPETAEKNPSSQVAFLGWNVSFRATPDEIVNHIKEISDRQGDPEILCLQEVQSTDPKDPEKDVRQIAEALGMEYHYAISNKAFLSRFQGKEKEVHHGLAILSKHPIIEGSKQTYDLREQKGPEDITRKLITVKVQVPGRVEPMTVGNFHLSPFAFHRRMNEARMLSSLIEECDIAFGDANAQPDSKYVKQIQTAHPRVDDRTNEPTFYSKLGEKVRKTLGIDKTYSRRLDYAFGKVSTEATIEDKGPSDHRPLFIKAKK